MSGPRAIIGPELKALVRQLVKAVGGVEACAVELGVTPQRISQLQLAGHPDQMSFLAISRLEAVCGQPVVTGAAARAAGGDSVDQAVGAAAVDAVGRAASLIGVVHAMDADGYRDAGEIRQVQRAAADLVREGAEALIASTQLTPGPVSS